MRSVPHSPELRGHDAAVRRALASGNHVATLSAAEAGAVAAAGVGDERAIWKFQSTAAEALHAMDRYSEMLALSRELVASPAADQDVILKARSLTLEAISNRCLGKSLAAAEAARHALLLLEPVTDQARIHAEAFQTLIAALVESGRPDEAWAHHSNLAALLDMDIDEQSAGKAFWTLGNLAFVVGDSTTGLAYHAKASTLLSPINDIQLWARFNRASADLQLQAGLAVEQTRDCIDRAMMAHEVMTVTEMDRIGLAETRARWGLATGDVNASEQVLEEATSGLDDPDAAYLIPAYRLWAEILESSRPADAGEKRAEANRIEGIAAANPS